MIFEGFAQTIGHLLATDGALMVLSMMFGVLLGMLWSGRSFPRRLPRAMMPDGCSEPQPILLIAPGLVFAQRSE